MNARGTPLWLRAPRADLVLALLVVAVIALMVVPLPTPLIDLLIALNLGFGVLLLAGALYLQEPLSLSAFPTLLLLGTLYRLSLNVASTRLILLQADAGRVIEAFGSFVVRGDYRVGALVFVMLTLVQFLVIARGAERVAEVSARFSLDALPGKQLAIDAELRAGSLSPAQARSARRRLERESQLYGALDGALKFVKGDAIAGIVITLINFVGGVSLGVFARDLPLTDSLETYGLLTVGDGLVTQLPSLLSATAAGLVVTRVAPEDRSRSLLADASANLLREPRALAIGALVLVALALVPALPSWPFLIVALACVAAAVRGMRRVTVQSAPLQLELGAQLQVAHAEVARAHAELEQALGFALPPHVVITNKALPPLAFRWVLRELPARVVQVSSPERASATLSAALAQLVRERAAELLDLDEVARLIEQLEAEHPVLVRHALPKPVSPTLLAQVLRLLVAEGIGVRWLSEIVEATAPLAADHPDAPTLAEQARRALSRRISHALAPTGTLHILRLSPELEEALSDGLRREERDEIVVLPADLSRDIVDAIAAAHLRAPAPHALVVTGLLRRHVRALLVERAPDLMVLSAHELAPSLTLAVGELIGP